MNLIYYIFNFIFVLFIFINYYISILLAKFMIFMKFKRDIVVNVMNNLINLNINLMKFLSVFNDIQAKKLNLKEKNYFINCNHTGPIDDILILTILNQFIANFHFEKVRSVSEVSSKAEEEIFDYIDSIVVKKKDFNLKIINDKINKIIKKYDNMSLILFLEGHSSPKFNELMRQKTRINLKNLNFPKTVIFELLCKKKYFNYLIDIDVIYYHKVNKKIISADSHVSCFLDPNTKTKVQINTYKLPEKDFDKWLINLYLKKDKNLEYMIKNL